MKLINLINKEVEINIVNNQNDDTFITHKGTFHADEVMATCILINKFGNINLCRTNEVINKNAFSYDIGFGKFDHHQADYNEVRGNGIKYASSGLLWKDYGRDILKNMNVSFVEELFEDIDKSLIMDIDRDDNGQALDTQLSIKIQSIPSIIGNFNPAWNDDKSEDDSFLEAVFFANTIFNKIVKRLVSKYDAKTIIEEKINESHDDILVLDCYMPWKDIVLSSSNPKANDILYAIFPSKRGGYNVVGVPDKIGSFDVKKPFPKKWAGLDSDSLKKNSGVKTISFCHKGLFICACKTFNDALLIAEIAKNNEEN